MARARNRVTVAHLEELTALRALADLARRLGDEGAAERLDERAARLREYLGLPPDTGRSRIWAA